ncbi:MAG TPA: DUF5615 family PIN-like protein [Phycisphaerales bacterium]|nr:DUF5615 family PIN-like protein [Phycisphaerales bacterium]
MRLLLDQSLAPRVAPAVADLFPGSVHAREARLVRAEDAELWLHARDGGYVLVSKAADFAQRAVLLGAPPKLVWVPGDRSTAKLIESLRDAAPGLRAFGDDPDRCLHVIHAGPRSR